MSWSPPPRLCIEQLTYLAMVYSAMILCVIGPYWSIGAQRRRRRLLRGGSNTFYGVRLQTHSGRAMGKTRTLCTFLPMPLCWKKYMFLCIIDCQRLRLDRVCDHNELILPQLAPCCQKRSRSPPEPAHFCWRAYAPTYALILLACR